MKTRLLVIIFSVFTFFFSEVRAQVVPELPNLSPISPEAYQFTKYGEVMVNESTGAISPSIPLYNFVAGDISIPITLNYGGNGVKVGQEPAWTGINWSVSTGGVITRQVRDIQDEKQGIQYVRKTYSKDELDGLPFPNDNLNSLGGGAGSWWSELTTIASTANVDSEVDIFNYNFPGYSGSFYLNDSYTKGVLLNYNKELEINFHYVTGNKSRIEIITPEGDVYNFGGVNASESSKAITQSVYVRGLSYPAQNAFYLYQIEPYNGGVIDFAYAQVNTSYIGYKVGEQEQLRKQEAYGCGGQTSAWSPPVEIKNEIESLVYLQTITSSINNNYVEFVSTSLGNRKRKLNTIYIKDTQDAIIKEFELDYTNTFDTQDGETNKFYLETVNFRDSQSVLINNYSLEYNSPGLLPGRWSKDQDHGGYFNDAGNIMSLLPEDSRFNNTITLANRETDVNTIQYGTLSKITYPTGGYSEFFYESPIKSYETTNHDNTTLRVYQDNPYDGTDEDEVTLWAGGDAITQGDGTYSLNTGDIITVNLSTDATGSYTDHTKVEVIAIENLGSNSTEYNIGYRELTNSENSTKSYSDTFSFEVTSTGEYTFKLKLDLDVDTNGLPIFSTAAFSIPNSDSSSQVPIYHPALRIKKVISKDSPVSSPMIKRYYYNSIININEENNVLMASPKYVTRTSETTCVGNPITYLTLSTNAINNAYSDDSGKILYPVVTVSYGGDNFELGAKESAYRVHPEAPIYNYFGIGLLNGQEKFIPVAYATSGMSSGNGLLLHEKYFNYNANTQIFSLLKYSQNIYELLETPSEQHNIKPGTIHPPGLGSNSSTILQYNFALYTLYSTKHVLTKTITTDYQLGQFPSTPLVTEQVFEYDDYVDRYSSVETTDSKGIESRTELFYPTTTVSSTSDFLSTAEKADIQALASQHRFNAPYMVKQYYDKNASTDEFLLQSSTQTISKTWSNGKIWPEYIKTAKAYNGVLMPYNNTITNPYEERIVFESYTSFGKPDEVKLKNGTTTKYFYNSQQQVTLKVENYDISEMDDNVPGSPSTPCFYQKTYPTSMVTVYEYNPDNGNLISIQDPKCQKITYEYDGFNRLKQVKDDDGKILSENEYHYKGQQ